MEDWIFYLILAVVAINVINMLRKQFGGKGFIEGLESRRKKSKYDGPAPVSKRPDLISGHTENHNLNLSDQRKDYEDMIVNMDTNIGTAMTKLLGEHSVSIAEDPMHPDSQKKMQALTTMGNFRNTLNETMNYIDGSK
tara:strand:+ start:1255 stop:1668 length:414 start_codon:yes stop_codon:yes gene_type:complete